MSDTADYVVIGAGTAGCILASRLSVDPHIRVALLEVGGMDSNPAIYDRAIDSMYSLWDPKCAENWGYATVPQPGLNGRVIDIAQGRVLGGGSAINAMMHIRGHRRCFDAWAELGNQGWSYEEILPYFKKSETYHGPISPYHGDNGPLSVIDIRDPQPVLHAFVEAHAELGAKEKYTDFNGPTQEAGAGFYQTTRTLDGVRVTAASAFLKPVLGRKNLRLLTQVRATRLLVEKGRVVGLEYAGPDGRQTIRAEREVAVCCGAFETPKLLMLSGIGPAEQLAAHDIPVVQDLSGVGGNLHDHLLLSSAFESTSDLTPPELAAEAGLLMWTPAGNRQEPPNLQYFFGPALQPSLQSFAPEVAPNRGFTFTPILSQPVSRGTVTLASRDPAVLARVDPQYLTRDEDVAVLEFGLRYARELVHTHAFDKLRGREIAPGAAATGSKELREYARRYCSTVWHPVGTCKMGVDEMLVVDTQLRVRGIEGLRVVDSSVMPDLVSSNTNAPTIMIAEKASDLIIASH